MQKNIITQFFLTPVITEVEVVFNFMQKNSKIVPSVSVKCCKKHNVTGVEVFCSGFTGVEGGLTRYFNRGDPC